MSEQQGTIPDVEETSTHQPEGEQPTAPNGDASPPAWFTSFSEKIEGRISQLGKDLGKVRHMAKGTATAPQAEEGATPAEPTTDSPQGAMTRDEVLAAQKLGRLQASLPDSAQEYLDGRVAGGASFEDVLREAELIKRFARGGAKPSAPVPPGHAATAPANPQGSVPSTMQELVELRKRDPDAYRRAVDSPDFRMPTH